MFAQKLLLFLLALALGVPGSSYKEPKFKTGLRWVFGTIALGAGAMSAYQYYRAGQSVNHQKTLQLQYQRGTLNSDFALIRSQFEAQGTRVDQYRSQGLVWGALGVGAGLGFGLTLVRF